MADKATADLGAPITPDVAAAAAAAPPATEPGAPLTPAAAAGDQPQPDPVIPVDTAPVAAVPQQLRVKVDNRTRRSDNDALEGCFCRIIAGDHAGLYGTFDRVVEYGDDGYPLRVLFLSRDSQNELHTVDYADLRPDVAGKR